ncbi:hypothetical protein BON30_06865 [Cystobacter ferrugineus]|uniref:Xylose isomerase-like TIM barrel domain-containing protein n=2 Tax=Cystobacter ferrugineus TaxID=83449 RepID=A0A1L9BEJ5_9BACT|nr:AP endonuclease family 2 [Cystobacter ferrugineus]OJH40663.1 hypothetical protein BON30_06865 [Cystobacter ferrugineus]
MAETTSRGPRIHGALMMPFANVRHLSYAEQLEATRLADFGQLSMHPHQARAELERRTAEEMLRMAADAGVEITRLDPLSNWNPLWLPTNMDAQYVRDFDISASQFFEICEALRIRYASVNATFAAGVYTHDEVVEHFAAVARRGAESGVILDLENIPLWGVRTVRDAWSIVADSGDADAGIVFDTLHYVRGGSTPEMLREVPGERIHVVQLNDGPLSLPPGVTLETNCFERDWPGEGEFPLVEILRILAEKDALRQVNPEVFSPTNDGRSPAEIARLSRESLQRTLADAGVA